MEFNFDRLTSKPFFISLACVTVAYFVAVRLFQDWLYGVAGIDQRPADMFLSFGPKFSQAEPFEIVLYLLGYAIVPVIAYEFTPFIERLMNRIRIRKSHVFVAGLCCLGVVVGVVILKFPFDRAFEYIQTHSLGHVLWFVATKRIVVTYLLLGLSSVFFVCYYWLFSRKKPPLIPLLRKEGTDQERLPLKKGGRMSGGTFVQEGVWEARLKRYWPLLLVVLAILIFNPNFPIDAHHYNYFVGSVHEVYQGKALLYESSNLYGLFNIYFLMALFKIIPLTFTAFCSLIMVVYFIYFSSLWAIIRKWLGSYTIATLAMVPIVAITYFFQTSPTRSALFLPAMSPFRWGFYVVVFWLILRFENTQQIRFLRWSLFVSAVSLFWNFDSGMFLSAATLLTIVYVKLYTAFRHSSEGWNPGINSKQKQTVIASSDAASGRGDPANAEYHQGKIASSQSLLAMTIQKVVVLIIEYLFYVIGLFAVTSVVNRLVYGSWPHWELFFRESKYFSTGIAMYPLPKVGVFEILFFVYAVVLVGAFARLLRRDDGTKPFNLPLLFLALFGVFSFVYYIGESSWQILYVVVAPFILICSYAYKTFCHGELVEPLRYGSPSTGLRMTVNNKWYRRVIRSAFTTIIFFGIALLAFKFPVEFVVRDYSNIGERFMAIDSLDQGTFEDAKYLAKHYPQQRIPVMSLNDTKLMMYSGKVNWFDFYYIFTIYFRSEMQKYVDLVLREQPMYIVIGTEKFQNDQVDYFLSGISNRYFLKESLKTVDVYQLKQEK